MSFTKRQQVRGDTSESCSSTSQRSWIPAVGALQHQPAEAQDAIERRANLVTHVGQEVALGTVCRDGGFLGMAQCLLKSCRSVMSRMNAEGASSPPWWMGTTDNSTGNSPRVAEQAVTSMRRLIGRALARLQIAGNVLEVQL